MWFMYMYICIVVHVYVSVKNQAYDSSTWFYITDGWFVKIIPSTIYHDLAVTI